MATDGGNIPKIGHFLGKHKNVIAAGIVSLVLASYLAPLEKWVPSLAARQTSRGNDGASDSLYVHNGRGPPSGVPPTHNGEPGRGPPLSVPPTHTGPITPPAHPTH